ncbi:MAG: glutamate 5-kinase [Candidatus Peribacteraceae bacterium]|nr:glutamate 5-kinase [Candidatus Peribacteraceae bacterium]
MSTSRRIIVKVGTNVLTNPDGLLDASTIASLVSQIVALKAKGTEVILVSSGAMAAGRGVICHGERSRTMTFRRRSTSRISSFGSAQDDMRSRDDVANRQILAAVGQVHLMKRYAELFDSHDALCAQVLATKEDFRDRRHYLNMRGCFSSLLEEGIVPVVNENDVVAVDELMFTDNDELAGLIASMTDADALLILSSVPGIMTGNPDHPRSKIIPEVRSDADWKKYLRAGTSSFGRGGMHTKCETGRKMASLGITTSICLGREPDVLLNIESGKNPGTVFLPEKSKSSIKRWVAEGDGQEKGIITINTCAVEAITAEGRARSLLPVGIVKIEGDFEKNDLLKIRDERGKDIGIGRAQYASAPAKEVMGKQGQKALIHYDYLYLS